jgi:hypothetical protein
MWFLHLLRWIFHRLIGKRAPLVSYGPERREPTPEDPSFADNLPPGWQAIETQVSGQNIDGTSCWVGEEARVIQGPGGHLLTCERGRGLRLGCGHYVYGTQERITPTGVLAGIGGVCHYCSLEVEELGSTLSAREAEAAKIYCTGCTSHCDGCGRRNLCSRHTKEFTDIEGKKYLLCPTCRKKAKRKKQRQQVQAGVARLLAWLFAENDTPSKWT